MDKRIVEIKTLKEGRYILIDDVPCKINKITHSKPGKHGGAKVKIEGTGIFNGQKKALMKPASDKAQIPVIDKRAGQVLTIIHDKVQIMDMESYETFEMDFPEDAEVKELMQEGKEIIYMQVGGQRKILQSK